MASKPSRAYRRRAGCSSGPVSTRSARTPWWEHSSRTVLSAAAPSPLPREDGRTKKSSTKARGPANSMLKPNVTTRYPTAVPLSSTSQDSPDADHRRAARRTLSPGRRGAESPPRRRTPPSGSSPPSAVRSAPPDDTARLEVERAESTAAPISSKSSDRSIKFRWVAANSWRPSHHASAESASRTLTTMTTPSAKRFFL